jgi:tetratricopeptide (TPR) repeat protein
MIRPEDEPKINRMALNLRRSKEIACILLILFNDELLRQDVEAELKRKLEPEGFNFRELRMTEDMYKNVPVIITREMNPQPNDIFQVFDLKKALPEVLEYLNYRREDFVEHKISVIFWLDEPTLIEIMRKALDFFAFRATPVIEFMADKSKDMMILGRITPNRIFIYNNLVELYKKIALREEILNDYLEKRLDDYSTIAILHNELGTLYDSKSELDKAMSHYEKAYELYKKIKNRKGEAYTLGNIGNLYQLKGELDKSLEYYSQAFDLNQRIENLQGEAFDLGNIGNLYYSKGELDKALEYHLQALDIDRKIGDTQGEASDLDNIGNVYYSKGEVDKSLEYFSQVSGVAHRVGNIQGKAITLGNIGIVYQNKGDLDKALGSYSQALEILRRIGYTQEEATVLGNIGNVYRLKGDLDNALEYYSQSLEIDRRIGYTQGEAIQLGNIGIGYQLKGDLDKALEYTKKALKIFVSIGVQMSADMAYKNLQEIISQMKSRGTEISQEDAKEITELTEQYEKLKGAVPNTVS